MALEQVQTASKGSAAAVANQTVSFASTPTKGNLLTCLVGSDATVTMNSSGWTLGKSQVNAIGLYQWEKIAGEAESKEVKCSPSVSDSIVQEITEWKSSTGGTIKLDKTAGANGTGTTCASGETTETAQAEELAIVAFCWQKITATVSYSNSFTAHLAPLKGVGSSEGTSVFLCTATRSLAAKGKQTTTMTASTTLGSGTSGLICTYFVEGGGGGKAWVQELADTVTATDALIKGSVKAIADSATGSDAVGKATTKPLADSVAAVDAIAKLPGKSLTDSVTASDALAKQARKGLSDSVTGAEVISKAAGKTLDDSAMAVDGLAKGPSKPLADSVVATDAVSKRPQKALAEIVTASDSLGKRVAKTLVDVATAVDSLAKLPAKLIFDAVTASDSIVARIIEKFIPLEQRPTKLFLRDSGSTLALADPAAEMSLGASEVSLRLNSGATLLALAESAADLELADIDAALQLQDREADVNLNG